MEAEGSLPCSQKLATAPYPEPTESSYPIDPYFPKLNLNVILPPTPQPPIQWVPGSLSLGVKQWGREADHLSPSSVEVK
jgi:hypothetical protein